MFDEIKAGGPRGEAPRLSRGVWGPQAPQFLRAELEKKDLG